MWIRPVSVRPNGEVSERERQYADGSDPKVLDVMDVPLLKPQPKGYQQENWLLDPKFDWSRKGRIGWDDLERLADPLERLWFDGHKTYNGLNDRIPLDAAQAVQSSLRLIRVKQLELRVFRPGEEFGDPKRRVQGRFVHAGARYWLWVTDPLYERRYLQRSDGTYTIGECFLTISLGEPHKDACYKLIAAIIERNGGVRA